VGPFPCFYFILSRFFFILSPGQFVFEFELRPGVVVYWFEVGGGFSGEVCVDAVGGEFFGWSAAIRISCHFCHFINFRFRSFNRACPQ
jgi:hypothetical protein